MPLSNIMSKNKNFTLNEILLQLQLIYSFFSQSRLITPELAYDDIEEDPSLVYNIDDDPLIDPYSKMPIIRNFQIKDKDIGYYLRQNFLIRFFCLLQFHGAYDDFDNRKHLSGYMELYILKKLRNRFSHTYGVYDRQDINLTENIVTHFNLPKAEYKTIPIPTKEVIDPIFEKSIQYIKELFKKP